MYYNLCNKEGRFVLEGRDHCEDGVDAGEGAAKNHHLAQLGVRRKIGKDPTEGCQPSWPSI